MSCKIKSVRINLQIIIINVYGQTQNVDKKKLCEEISIFIRDHNNEYILLGGDFNVILNIDEKYRGMK